MHDFKILYIETAFILKYINHTIYVIYIYAFLLYFYRYLLKYFLFTDIKNEIVILEFQKG